MKTEEDKENEEATERPGENEDTSQYMKEMQDFKEEQIMEKGIWKLSDGISAHPLFWFIWNEVPGNNDAAFIGRLADILGASWIMEATIEKSSDMLSMIAIKGDNMIQLELCPELSGVIITDKEGETLREVTARESKGKTYCFSTLLCNRKLVNMPLLCFNAAMPGKTKCTSHYRPTEGRKPGLTTLAVTSVITGAGCLPSDAMYFWSQNKPEIAQFVKDLAESFRIKLGWDESHTLINELRYIAVQIVSRDLMTNKVISADFKGAVHDPETGQIVAFKAHYLLNCLTTFDARIQQKLKDFGLLVPPSRTEDTQSIPGELSLLWTPLKRVNSIDVTARIVKHDNAQNSEDETETEEGI
jgi:hypothetical protein